jgi:rod shape-determining protein MreC
MGKLRKAKSPQDIMRYGLSFLKSSHLKFSNIFAVLVCFTIVWFLNSEHEASKITRAAVFEWNAMVQALFNKQYEISNKAKEIVDNALYLNQIRELQDRNKVLEEKITRLEVENRELDKMKKILDFKVSGNYKSLATRIMRSTLDSNSQSLLVAAGSVDAVTERSFVVDGENLVGKVVEVGRDAAEVEIITNVNSKTPVLLTESNMKAVLSGEGSSNILKVIYLSGVVDVVDGEVAITSGDGSIYPHGVMVGRVRKMGGEVFVEPLFDYSTLNLVKVYTRE